MSSHFSPLVFSQPLNYGEDEGVKLPRQKIPFLMQESIQAVAFFYFLLQRRKNNIILRLISRSFPCRRSLFAMNISRLGKNGCYTLSLRAISRQAFFRESLATSPVLHCWKWFAFSTLTLVGNKGCHRVRKIYKSFKSIDLKCFLLIYRVR